MSDKGRTVASRSDDGEGKPSCEKQKYKRKRSLRMGYSLIEKAHHRKEKTDGRNDFNSE